MGIIINADDFGYSEVVTKAIVESFTRGLITDTTMMANGEAFDYGVEMIHQESLSDRIGFHMNLTEGYPMTEQIKRLASFTVDGCFHGNINRKKRLSREEKEAVYKEITAQIQKLINNGVEITHADSHHHIHTVLSIAPIFLHVCKENGINKIRIHRNIGNIPFYKQYLKNLFNYWLKKNGITTVKYFGSMKDLVNSFLLDRMEIMVHPDYNIDGILIDRIKRVNGMAIGPELTPITEAKDILSTYKDLK